MDGVDLRLLDPLSLRKFVGFVPQETFLFGETLRRNILLGAPDDGRLERVAEIAQLTEALPALPRRVGDAVGLEPVNELRDVRLAAAVPLRQLRQREGLGSKHQVPKRAELGERKPDAGQRAFGTRFHSARGVEEQQREGASGGLGGAGAV